MNNRTQSTQTDRLRTPSLLRPAATNMGSTIAMLTVGILLLWTPAAFSAMSTSPAALTFSGTAGGANPAAQSFTITNTGTGTVSWTVGTNASWIASISPLNGTNTGPVTIGVNLSGLAAGTYNTTLYVGTTGGTIQLYPVSLTVNPAGTSTTPTIGLGTTSLAFTGTAGGANPASQSFTISNTGSGTLAWTASDNAAWLSLSPATGTNTGTVTATVNLTGLAAGTYSGTITTSAAGATTRTIPVSLTVNAASTSTSPVIGFSPTKLAFTGTVGGANPAAQSFTLSNTGSGTLTWSVRTNASWIASISPLNGTNTGTVTIGVNLSGLAAGTYNTTLYVGGTGLTVKLLPVSLTVNAASASTAATPVIGLSASSLTFGGAAGGANPAAQSFTISNTGSGTLTWTASDNAAWLTLSPATGTNTGTVTATVNLAGLTAGTYSGTITAAATGATSRTIPVSLTVNPATTATPIIGLSLASLTYAGTAGGTNPAAQSFTVSNTGAGTLTWTAGDSASWLTLTPATGTNTGTVSASVNLTGLAAGTYSGTITVSAAGATSKTLPVSLTVGAGTATTNSATLTWVANTETDLAGYKIYVGTQSGVYGAPIVLGRVNTYQVTNLIVGTTYFFCITAYDNAGNESLHSAEVTKSIF